MSIYVFKQWPQLDILAKQLLNDPQAEIVIISDTWPASLNVETPAGRSLVQQWQQARMLWQQQPVFSYPFEQGKLLVILPEIYAHWCLYNTCAGYNPIDSSSILKPWLQIPQTFTINSVVIIGAGIAGAATAHALALRNIPVTVIEQNEIASAGSGNYQGLLYAKISPHSTQQSELLLSGYGYSVAFLKKYLPSRLECGVLHLDFNNIERQRNQQLSTQCPDSQLYQSVTRTQASALAGIDLPSGGLWWSHGITANPHHLVQILLSHPLIKVYTHTKVKHLFHAEKLWQVQCCTQQGSVSLIASHIVICAGAESNQLNPILGWPLKFIRGQTTTAVPGNYANKLCCALSASSYITPQWQHKMCFGATFHPNCPDTSLTTTDEQINWQQLANWLPKLAKDLQGNHTTQGHAALRCDAYDHLPVVGPIGDTRQMLNIYAKLKQDKNYPINTPCPWLPGAFINTAHGSRGLATAPICAEAIAAVMLGLPSPLSARLQQALHPSRLLIRTLTHHRNI